MTVLSNPDAFQYLDLQESGGFAEIAVVVKSSLVSFPRVNNLQKKIVYHRQQKPFCLRHESESSADNATQSCRNDTREVCS